MKLFKRVHMPPVEARLFIIFGAPLVAMAILAIIASLTTILF